MHPNDLFDELKKNHGLTSNVEIGGLLGLTPSRISQMSSSDRDLTARQVASYLSKAESYGAKQAFRGAIRPIVEMYEVSVTASKQDAKQEIIPTDNGNQFNKDLRKILEGVKGIYIFYDSLGCPIYVGKTERQNLWREMNNAFNRHRTSLQAFMVDRPKKGEIFQPAWEKPKQLKKKVVTLHATASYFSAYEVQDSLISTLEAMLVRSFCNSLSNKKMENF